MSPSKGQDQKRVKSESRLRSEQFRLSVSHKSLAQRHDSTEWLTCASQNRLQNRVYNTAKKFIFKRKTKAEQDQEMTPSRLAWYA